MRISTDKVQIHQIFYDEKSKQSADPGFIPLDNSFNYRPDWREYWPIRNYLLSRALDPNTWYGFFSPKFFDKTGLNATEVNEFICEHCIDFDIALFSPFFDQSAFFLNIFEQGIVAHPGSKSTFEQSVQKVAPQINLEFLVMDSRSVVFCNFIVAKPIFWKRWLSMCEQIFALAESNGDPLAIPLNQSVAHDTTAACKTFVIERIASLLLSTNKELRVKNYRPLELPLAQSKIGNEIESLVIMDALKMAYLTTQNPKYIEIFRATQKMIIEKYNYQI
jgi:hypothetical protein